MISGKWEKKRETVRHYDELAIVYDSLYQDEQSLKIEPALEAVGIRNSDLVLDAGCGTGLLFDYVADFANLLVGIDTSLGLLKVAAERSKRLQNRSSISLIRADAEYMPIRTAVFDKVFALTLLQDMSDPNLALREMMRVARKGSRIVVTGLKKSFSEETFKNILNQTGLEFSMVRTAERTRDYVAVCYRN